MARLNGKSVTLVTAPAVEPVSLAELKSYARVEDDTDNDLLTSLITTARLAAEEYTKRSFIRQTWDLTLDFFAERLREDLPPGWLTINGSPNIKLPRGPVSSITSIVTFNAANTESTVAAATYTLDTASGEVLLNQGYAWPSDLREYAAVRIRYLAGYGTEAASVPQPIKQAIIMHATALYETRCMDMAGPVKALLDPYRTPEAFGLW